MSIVINFTIFNFIIQNNGKLKMTSLSSCIVAFVISSSLSNFIISLIAGAVVLTLIGTAVALVSNNDRVTRN